MKNNYLKCLYKRTFKLLTLPELRTTLRKKDLTLSRSINGCHFQLLHARNPGAFLARFVNYLTAPSVTLAGFTYPGCEGLLTILGILI